MNRYFTRIKLNTKTISDLRDIVSMLEHDMDDLENLRGIEENHFTAVQEKVFELISLIANLEGDIEMRVNCMVADYCNGLYAKIADIEATLKILKQNGYENYPIEEVII